MIIMGGKWYHKKGKATLVCANGDRPTKRIIARCGKDRRWIITPKPGTFSSMNLCRKKNLLKPGTLNS